MYYKETEPCSAETKCNFTSFKAVKSFWTKQQCFIPQKVGRQKWCQFFDFVYLGGCHFTKSGSFQKQIGNRGGFFGFMHVSYGNN